MNIENSLPRSTDPPSGPSHDWPQGFVPLPERLFLLLENPIHFARYLDGSHPGARAGVPRDGLCCPLARFLVSETGTDPLSLEVGSERVFFGEGSPTGMLPVAPLPCWAQLFVEVIDATAGPEDSRELTTISEMKAILDEVVEPPLPYRDS